MLERIRATAPAGGAVTGVRETLRALNADRVATLVVPLGRAEPGVRCVSCGYLGVRRQRLPALPFADGSGAGRAGRGRRDGTAASRRRGDAVVARCRRTVGGGAASVLTAAGSPRGAVVRSRTMPGPLAVGVDVGGTKVAALLTDDRGTVLDRKVVHSPANDAEATVGTVVSLARDLADANEGVIAVGIGAAGLVSREGVMRFAPNIAWREFPIGERVADGVGLPVLVDNDANVAAWGEFKYGAGRGTNHLLLVTVGTGIGGGIVADGSPVPRRPRLRRRDRPHHRRPGRSGLRLRQRGVLGAGRVRTGHRAPGPEDRGGESRVGAGASRPAAIRCRSTGRP